MENRYKIAALNNINWRAKDLHNSFDFKTESALNRKVSFANSKNFDLQTANMIQATNELIFLTVGENNKYANEIFKLLKKLLLEGNKIMVNDGINQQMVDLINPIVQQILDYVYIIDNQEDGFKNVINKTVNTFDESWFIEVSKKIALYKDTSVFFNELNGGELAVRIKNAFPIMKESEITLYGVDTDINLGYESIQRDIKTARGGISSVSKHWCDIAFCKVDSIDFDTRFGFFKTKLHNFYYSALVKKKGIIVFNYPFYRIQDIEVLLKNNEILAAINTQDEFGNIVFVLRYGVTSPQSKKILKKIEFQSNSLPMIPQETTHYTPKEIVEVKNFRGKYVDMDDMKDEFSELESSSDFVFDYFKPRNKLTKLENPLMEYKAGHIPAMATSEIINGRYVDEIMKDKIGKEFGFDHLFSTKIVKKDIEEKEVKVDKDGNEYIEVSEKKSNVIVSIALTADGDYVELFTNENEKK